MYIVYYKYYIFNDNNKLTDSQLCFIIFKNLSLILSIAMIISL